MKIGRYIVVGLFFLVLFTAGITVLHWQWWAVLALLFLFMEVK